MTRRLRDSKLLKSNKGKLEEESQLNFPIWTSRFCRSFYEGGIIVHVVASHVTSSKL